MISRRMLRLSPSWYHVMLRPSTVSSTFTLVRCELSGSQKSHSENNAIVKEKICSPSNIEEEDRLLENSQTKIEPFSYFDKIKYMTLEQLIEEAENVSTLEEADVFLGTLCSQIKLIEITYKSAIHPIEDIFGDVRLQKIFSLYDFNDSNIPHTLWINCNRSLLKFKSKTKDDFVSKAESHLIKIMKDFSSGDLIRVYNIYEPLYHYSMERKTVFEEVSKHLHRKCNDVLKPKEIVSLMYIFSSPESKDAFEKLEERCVKYVDQFKMSELCKVIFIASRTQRRNDVFLKTMTDQMKKNENIDLSHLQISKLLYAFGTLNIFDVELLDRICSNLKREIATNKFNLAVLCSVIVSLGRLRWKDESLLESCLKTLLQSQYIQKKHKENKNVVKALAILDYRSNTSEQFISQRTNTLSNDPTEWLDFVWSLVSLEKANNKLLRSVLNMDFIEKVSAFDSKLGDKYKGTLNMQRLKNIECAARYEALDYDEPFLPESYPSFLSKDLIGCEKKLRDLVFSALSKMTPSEKYLNTTETPGGHCIEAILNVDNKGRPIQLSSVFDGETVHRICIKIQSFSDTTLKTEGPTGSMAMACRHLKLMGFKVVVVPYSVLSGKPTVINIVQYIEQAIQEAIKKS